MILLVKAKIWNHTNTEPYLLSMIHMFGGFFPAAQNVVLVRVVLEPVFLSVRSRGKRSPLCASQRYFDQRGDGNE